MNNHVRLSHISQYSDQVAHVEAGDRHFPWCIKVWLVLTYICISYCVIFNWKYQHSHSNDQQLVKGRWVGGPLSLGRESWLCHYGIGLIIYMYPLFWIFQVRIYRCIFWSVRGLFFTNGCFLECVSVWDGFYVDINIVYFWVGNMCL